MTTCSHPTTTLETDNQGNSAEVCDNCGFANHSAPEAESDPNDEIYDLIPDAWEHFSFTLWYRHEGELLKPALEKLGYTNVTFFMGEADSWGPLTRVICATTPAGERKRWIYG